MWPDVAILVPTYNRADVCVRTVDLLLKNLSYCGDMHFLVGCDGTDNTPDKLEDWAAREGVRDRLMVLREPSGGIGANINRLIERAHMFTDFYVSLDDDHHLIGQISLSRHVEKLRDDRQAGWIHLMMEALGDEHFDPYKFQGVLDKDHYWRIDWDCPERFVMSFRPHIFHHRFIEVMGYLNEGLKTGETEWEYAGRTKRIGSQGGGVDVLVPLCAYGCYHWRHDAADVSWNQRGL
jgi:glycosyltransferase involved in cell wall biosynthesis